jgi:hypothetical protein
VYHFHVHKRKRRNTLAGHVQCCYFTGIFVCIYVCSLGCMQNDMCISNGCYDTRESCFLWSCSVYTVCSPSCTTDRLAWHRRHHSAQGPVGLPYRCSDVHLQSGVISHIVHVVLLLFSACNTMRLSARLFAGLYPIEMNSDHTEYGWCPPCLLVPGTWKGYYVWPQMEPCVLFRMPKRTLCTQLVPAAWVGPSGFFHPFFNNFILSLIFFQFLRKVLVAVLQKK